MTLFLLFAVLDQAVGNVRPCAILSRCAIHFNVIVVCARSWRAIFNFPWVALALAAQLGFSSASLPQLLFELCARQTPSPPRVTPGQIELLAAGASGRAVHAQARIDICHVEDTALAPPSAAGTSMGKRSPSSIGPGSQPQIPTEAQKSIEESLGE